MIAKTTYSHAYNDEIKINIQENKGNTNIQRKGHLQLTIHFSKQYDYKA